MAETAQPPSVKVEETRDAFAFTRFVQTSSLAFAMLACILATAAVSVNDWVTLENQIVGLKEQYGLYRHCGGVVPGDDFDSCCSVCTCGSAE